ncbi:MAG: hypothetical protein SP1CHLAM54_10230 [Chlamydiia bacterium]|nr:hypothetical protein [Chlamydiia bacterium]MCH9615929.1 hypothetical protein [Chlamydiia bacterium]MCH9628668.1 hypothetical protein [Chlamydiia bacterium]
MVFFVSLKLFAAPPIPTGVVSEEVLSALMGEVETEVEGAFCLQNDERTKRKTREFGYSFFKLEAGDHSFREIPACLMQLGNEVCRALGRAPEPFTNVILSVYGEGYHLEPHVDIDQAQCGASRYYFDECVYGVVLEADETGHLYFIKDDKHYIPPLDLEKIYEVDESKGAVYCLEGPYRHFPFHHGVTDVAKKRISVTFRKVVFI